MINVFCSIPEFDTSYKAHSPIVVQSLTEGFFHENEEVGREGTTLFETLGRLECFTWPTVDQGGDPGPRDTSYNNINEGRFEAHLF